MTTKTTKQTKTNKIKFNEVKNGTFFRTDDKVWLKLTETLAQTTTGDGFLPRTFKPSEQVENL